MVGVCLLVELLDSKCWDPRRWSLGDWWIHPEPCWAACLMRSYFEMLKRMFQTVESELKKYTTLNAPTLLEQIIKTHIFLTDFFECSCNTSASSSKKPPSFSTRPETSCGAAFIVYTMMGGVDGETRGAHTVIRARFEKKRGKIHDETPRRYMGPIFGGIKLGANVAGYFDGFHV